MQTYTGGGSGSGAGGYRHLNRVDVLNASTHLRRLRDRGLLEQKGKGSDTYYKQFSEQAFLKGSTTLWFRAFWEDEHALETVTDFFLSKGVIFHSGSDQDDRGDYYRITLFPPTSLDKHSDMFEALRQHNEPEIIKTSIEQIAEIIRYDRSLNYWLAFSVIDCS